MLNQAIGPASTADREEKVTRSSVRMTDDSNVFHRAYISRVRALLCNRSKQT